MVFLKWLFFLWPLSQTNHLTLTHFPRAWLPSIVALSKFKRTSILTLLFGAVFLCPFYQGTKFVVIWTCLCHRSLWPWQIVLWLLEINIGPNGHDAQLTLGKFLNNILPVSTFWKIWIIFDHVRVLLSFKGAAINTDIIFLLIILIIFIWHLTIYVKH